MQGLLILRLLIAVLALGAQAARWPAPSLGLRTLVADSAPSQPGLFSAIGRCMRLSGVASSLHSCYNYISHLRWRRKYEGGAPPSSAERLELESSNASSDSDEAARLVQQTVALAEKFLELPLESHWALMGTEDGISVWKLVKPVVAGYDHRKWPCLMARTVVDLPVDMLKRALLDSSKANVLNKFSAGRTDVELVDAESKLVWSRTRVPLAIKPFDYSTLIHTYSDPKDGSTLIVSKGITSPKIPEHEDYCRSEVIFGMNILRPSGADGGKTDFTSISHVRYAGVPPFLAWRSCYGATLSYMKQLRAGAPQLRDRLGRDGDRGGQ